MKHSDVKRINRELISLANHSIEKRVDNWHFNYALGKNIDRFEKEVASYDKAVVPELKELEDKAFKLAQEKISNLSEEEKSKITNVFMFGYSDLTDEEKSRHTELMKGYNEFMEEESTLEPYYFNPEKIQDVKLEFMFAQILRQNFIKE